MYKLENSIVSRMAFMDKAVPRPGARQESAPSISAAAHRRHERLPIVAVDTATGACAGACAGGGGGWAASEQVYVKLCLHIPIKLGVGRHTDLYQSIHKHGFGRGIGLYKSIWRSTCRELMGMGRYENCKFHEWYILVWHGMNWHVLLHASM